MKKIPTIFKRNLENMRVILQEPNPLCGWVFDGEGVATRKYDGTCVKIERGCYYKRREVKDGKMPPVDFIQEDFDQNTGKKVGWVAVDFDSKEDRYHVEAFSSAYSDGTYELVGPKIQANPEHYKKHMLIKHSEAEILPNVPRTYQGIADYMSKLDIEGIVFHHPDGRMAKIKKKDYKQKRV